MPGKIHEEALKAKNEYLEVYRAVKTAFDLAAAKFAKYEEVTSFLEHLAKKFGIKVEGNIV